MVKNGKMKKHSDSRKHCALAVVRLSQKKFCLAADPLRGPLTIFVQSPWSRLCCIRLFKFVIITLRYGGAGRPKFNHLEMVTTFTYRPSLVKIDTCNFELSW